MTNFAYGSVDPRMPLEDFIALWNTRGKLLEQRVNREVEFHIEDFGARPNGLGDCSTAWAKALAEVTRARTTGAQGTIVFGAGDYQCLSQLAGLPAGIATPAGAIVIRGQGGVGNSAVATADAATNLIGAHNEPAVLNLQGCAAHAIEGINFRGLGGGALITPKTGLCLGRLNPALPALPPSAGSHRITRCGVTGYFSQAAVYSVASENNVWLGNQIVLNGGGAVHAVYTSQTDAYGVSSLGGATNIANRWIGTDIVNYIDDPAASCFVVDAGVNTKALDVYGGYFAGVNGSYVTIRVGHIDLQDVPGDLSFVAVSGERVSGSGMLQGYDLISEAPGYSLSGLSILGGKMDTGVGGAFVRQASTVTLRASQILVAEQSNPSSLIDAQCDDVLLSEGNGLVHYGAFTNTGAVTLSGGLVSYGAADSAGAGFRTMRVPN